MNANKWITKYTYYQILPNMNYFKSTNIIKNSTLYYVPMQ